MTALNLSPYIIYLTFQNFVLTNLTNFSIHLIKKSKNKKKSFSVNMMRMSYVILFIKKIYSSYV